MSPTCALKQAKIKVKFRISRTSLNKTFFWSHYFKYVKATSLYWNRLFTCPAVNLTDEIFVFKCKRWVTSFIEMGRGKEELEILKATFARARWGGKYRLKQVVHALENKVAIASTEGTEDTEEHTAKDCEHSKVKERFLSTPFVSPTEEEKNILAQGLLENQGNLLKCIPLRWDAQQVGLFLFKNPWVFSLGNGLPEMEVIWTGRLRMDSTGSA
jgi:hypothetical protein